MNNKLKPVQQPEMKPVPKEIKRFQKFFHPGLKATFQSYRTNGIGSQMPRYFSGILDQELGEKLVAANVDGMEISMLINRANGGGRKSSDITDIVAVFADFDDSDRTKEQLLEELPIEPHLLVQTSPGNFHAYWLVKGCRVDQFKSVQKALAQQLGSDMNVCDPSRVMRMPGTINWKRDEPFLVKIVHMDDHAVALPIAKFVKNMDLPCDVLTQTAAVSSEAAIDLPAKLRGLTPQVREDIKAALAGVPAEDRWVWWKVGAAIHSIDSTKVGYELWTNWSEQSDKFKAGEHRKLWTSFKTGGAVNIETLFWLANHFGTSSSGTFDEMSLAQLFADTVCDHLRYDRQAKSWYCFTGVVWELDQQAPQREAHSFIKEMTSTEKSMINDSIKRFRTGAAIRAIGNHAELLDKIYISDAMFDKNPNLLAVKNGVVDLVTGEFRPAVATDYLRRQANVMFAAEAKCPHWIKFMKSVTREDYNLYRFIQRALGYTLVGHANLQLFFMAVGSGGNGKGVLMRTIQKILGGYAQSVPPNLLTTAYGGNVNSPSPVLARLNGARLVVCTELPTGKKMDEAFIKQYAGGDDITARGIYGDVITFKPEGKLWLSTNEVPEIAISDEAMWRRLKPIPFLAKFQGADVDPELEQKLAEEYSGILNWLLSGARSFANDGLGTCDAVDELEEKMRKEADSVLAWVTACCVKAVDAILASSAAYESYADFMRRFGRKPLNQPAFNKSLNDKEISHRKTKVGNIFGGLRLLGNNGR